MGFLDTRDSAFPFMLHDFDNTYDMLCYVLIKYIELEQDSEFVKIWL